MKAVEVIIFKLSHGAIGEPIDGGKPIDAVNLVFFKGGCRVWHWQSLCVSRSQMPGQSVALLGQSLASHRRLYSLVEGF
jgi:hypothetical protein